MKCNLTDAYSVGCWHIACQFLGCALEDDSVSVLVNVPTTVRCKLTRPTYEAPTTMMFLRDEAMALLYDVKDEGQVGQENKIYRSFI